jgi:ERCC4-type nuclease
MTIVVDTRETLAYRFKGISLMNKKLEVGDYSILGFEKSIAIERKGSAADFLASIGRRREEFLAMLERLSLYEARLLIIESNLSELFNYPRSRISRETVLGFLAKICLDLGIPVMLVGNRQAGEELTWKFLSRFFLKKRCPQIFEE